VTQERRTTFFTGTLLDPDDFRLDQDSLHGRSRTIGLAIQENGAVEQWAEVPSLGASAPGDRHFTLDRGTGRIRFGDGEHGRRPAAGSRIEASYRCGGGRAWLAVPVGAALAGFLAAFLRHRRA
jgi:hypothetical protein